jgi:hypothetical protein
MLSDLRRSPRSIEAKMIEPWFWEIDVEFGNNLVFSRDRRLSSSGTENLGKDFPSLPTKASCLDFKHRHQTTLQGGATDAVRRVRRTREA